MKLPKYIFSMLWLAALGFPVQAEDYSLSTWKEDMNATRWETGVLLLGVTGLGFSSWKWGSSKTFRWQNEGWFEPDTYLGGSDKLGHAYTAYTATNVLYDHLQRQGVDSQRAMLSATLTTQAILTYMEVLDGFSSRYGFSPEDIAMNLLGSGMAYARAVTPGMRELVDFRLEYELPGYRGMQFRSNYLLALKLGGFESLRDLPLRYVELQGGYSTRGYIRAEQNDGYAPSRFMFVGIGLNVSELLLGPRKDNESRRRSAGRLLLEHWQVPFTASRSAREL